MRHDRQAQEAFGGLQGQGRPGGGQQWKKQFLDGAESLFRDGRRREREEEQATQSELYERIGRLNVEVEWLKKSVARCG